MFEYNYLVVFLFYLSYLVELKILERVTYNNYHVYEVTASCNTKLKVLRDIALSSNSVIFLNEPYVTNQVINVVVAPHKVPDFLELLTYHKINYKQKETNLQERIDAINKPTRISRDVKYNWESYQPLKDTYKWLKTLSIKNFNHVSLINLGRTYQNRSILSVKLSKNKNSKGAIFIMAGVHAREWVTVTTATYIINTLVNSADQSLLRVIHNYDWYIIPHANPDGYIYSYSKDRLWRKNRTPYGNCFGVDLNRNWDHKWNTNNSSNNPCSPTFAGPFPFSEIEIRTIAKFIKSLKGKVRLFISLHSYSQLILFPYGYSAKLPKNYNDYERVLNVSLAAIKQRYGTNYTGGNTYKVLYSVSGVSMDWTYDVANISMSFCYELRPLKQQSLIGFILPPSQIIPTAEETLDSIIAMVNEVDQLGYFK